MMTHSVAELNVYLARCVDAFEDPTLPTGVTAVQAVAVLEQIRQSHRDDAANAKRYIDRSGANAEAREAKQQVYDRHRERVAYATALIRRFRKEAKA